MKQVRALALTLCLLMVVSMFAACNGDKTPDNPITPSNGTAGNAFEGEHFAMVGGDAIFPRNRRDYTDVEKEKEDNEGAPILTVPMEAMQQRILELEAKYKIEIEACSSANGYWQMTSADFMAQFVDGTAKVDLFHAELVWARDLYNAGKGIVEPIDNLKEYINSEDYNKWGSKAMLQATTYKGVLWGVPWHGSAYSAVPYVYYGQMLCNPQLLESFLPGASVQEMVESGKWTFDDFSELVPKVSSSTSLNKIYGYLYQQDFPMLAVYANGGDRVIWDDAKQKYVFGLTSKNVENALDWAKRFVEDTADSTGLATEISTFTGGTTTFFTTNGNRIFSQVANEMEKDAHQFVPFPYGPDAEYGKTYSIYIQRNDSASGVFHNPTNDSRTKFSAKLFNEITEPVISSIMPDGYQKWLYRQNWAEGEEYSFGVYTENGLNVHWNYSEDLGKLNSSVDAALTSIVMQGKTMSALQRLEEKVNEQLDLTVNP